MVESSADDQTGIALVECSTYFSRNSDSDLGNISTRGFVGNGDDILIAGFIIGTRNSAIVVLRVLGPSLADAGVQGTLNDPKLTIYDSNGVSVGGTITGRMIPQPRLSNSRTSLLLTQRKLPPSLPWLPAPTPQSCKAPME